MWCSSRRPVPARTDGQTSLNSAARIRPASPLQDGGAKTTRDCREGFPRPAAVRRLQPDAKTRTVESYQWDNGGWRVFATRLILGIKISTRRLRALPSSVSLLAIGW